MANRSVGKWSVLDSLRLRKREKLGSLLSEFWTDRNTDNLGRVLEETQRDTLEELEWYEGVEGRAESDS